MTFRLREAPGDPLRQMALHLREAPKYVQRQAGAAIAAGIQELIDRGFSSGTDPYGAKWPLPKDGHRPPMIRRGVLRASYTVKVVPGGIGYSIQILSSAPHAKYLQKGTSRMAARMQVPGARLPPAYQDLFKRCYDTSIGDWWSRRPNG